VKASEQFKIAHDTYIGMLTLYMKIYVSTLHELHTQLCILAHVYCTIYLYTPYYRIYTRLYRCIYKHIHVHCAASNAYTCIAYHGVNVSIQQVQYTVYDMCNTQCMLCAIHSVCYVQYCVCAIQHSK